MKTTVSRFLLILWLATHASSAPAALTASWTGSQVIPDNNASGLAFSFDLSDPATSITDIFVTVDISGGFNGDLYAYLSHGDGFAVLLNRVGRTSTSDLGYSTAGMAVTLSCSAVADIHNYQNLSPTLNGTGQLTGIWAVDGRDTDPALTLDSSLGLAPLTSFDGKNPNGDWVLYFSDVSGGGTSTVNGWSVTVVASAAPVPEPSSMALVMLGSAMLLLAMLNRQSQRDLK